MCQFLHGGLRPALGITEICGEAGAGKSTFALRLALQVQLPRADGGLAGAAVYIATEHFSDKRLRQLATAFPPCRPRVSLDRVYLQSARSLDDLAAILTQLPLLMRARGVRLVVLDSIAALFRAADLDAAAPPQHFLFERSNLLFSLARRLRALADEFGAVVLVTNQVTDVVAAVNAPTDTDNSAAVRAALGPSWSACVTTRLALRKASGPAMAHGAAKRARRDLSIPSTAATAAAVPAVGVEATRFLSVSLSPTLECGGELALGVNDGGLFGVSSIGH